MHNLRPNELLQHVEHRPFPVPDAPWLVTQIWHDLLFAHWPVDPEHLRALVPPQLPLDLYDGQAWVGIVPFWMSGTRARFSPPVPHLSTSPEINVRTYVTLGGKPGVYFFSLDLPRILGVWGARAYYKLRYFYAEAAVRQSGEWTEYRSLRRPQQREGKNPEFIARYRPLGTARFAESGSLEEWFTERYCLYAVSRGGRVLRANIHHLRWPLQPAEWQVEVNSMASSQGIQLPDTPPLLHYAKEMQVLIWGREWCG